MNTTYTVLAPNPQRVPAHLLASDMHLTLIPHANPRYLSYKAHTQTGAQRILDAWANGQLVLTDIVPADRVDSITQPFCAASSTFGVKGCRGSTADVQVFNDISCNWALKRIQSSRYDWKLASSYTYDDSISGANNAIVAVLDTGVSVIPEFDDPTGIITNNTRVTKATASVPGTDNEGHGTNVASMAAGLTFGIAKNAAIVDCGMVGGGIDEDTMLTNLIAVMRKNPTKLVIGNCSWGSYSEWPYNHPLAGGNFRLRTHSCVRKNYADLSVRDKSIYDSYNTILSSNQTVIVKTCGNAREIFAGRRGYMYTDYASKAAKDIGDSQIIQTFLGGPAGLDKLGAVLTAMFLIQNTAGADVKVLSDYTTINPLNRGVKYTPVLIKVSGNVKQASFMFEQSAVNVINRSLPIVTFPASYKYNFVSKSNGYPDQGALCYVQMLSDDGTAFANLTWSDPVIYVGIGDRAFLSKITGIAAVNASGVETYILFLVTPGAVAKFVNSFTGNNVRGKPNQAFITSALRCGGSGDPRPICLQAWVPPLGCGSKCGLNFEDVTLWNDGTSALAKTGGYLFLNAETIYPFKSPAYITAGEPNMFFASATTIDDQIAKFSGVAWGGMYAPGQQVRMAGTKELEYRGPDRGVYFQFQPGWKSAWLGKDYVGKSDYWSSLDDGTSFACPCISGLCAAYIAKTKITDVRQLSAWLSLNFVSLPGRTRDATIPLSSDEWAVNVNAKETLFNTQIGDYDSRNTPHKKLGFLKIGSVYMASTP